MGAPVNSGGRGGGIIDGINITPMVDVILVILVIFMVTTTLVQEDLLPVDLPAADAPPEEKQRPPDRLTVSVDASGQIFFSQTQRQSQNREPLTLIELGEVLAAVHSTTPNAHVTLRADRQRSYGEIIGVLEVIRTAGISSVGFAVAEPAAP